MPLTRVTITGADDEVLHGDLVALWNMYPFVEWGILFSESRTGTPRYPSKDWVEMLCALARVSGMRLSAHFCGSLSRKLLAGAEEPLMAIPARFARAQVNGFEKENLAFMSLLRDCPGVEWILQAGTRETLASACFVAGSVPGVSVLWDASGGRGVPIDQSQMVVDWVQRRSFPMGYAGGISPENVEDVLRMLAPIQADYWIDMESGVRTNDRFTGWKALKVLELAKPYVEAR